MVDDASAFQAMAIAPFEAGDPAEMSLAELELVTVLTTNAPEGWCFAEKGGTEGLVPKDYVVRLQPAELLADFTAEEEPEISVAQGERVLVIPRPAPEGWTFVSHGSRQGLVPREFLEFESGKPTTEMDMSALLQSAQPALVAADFEPEDPAEMRVRAGDLVLILEQRQDTPGWSTVTSFADPSQAPGLVPTEFLDTPHGEMKADFEAEYSSELSCAKGSRVWLTRDQPESKSGWTFVVSETGERGLVPSDFIYLFQAAEGNELDAGAMAQEELVEVSDVEYVQGGTTPSGEQENSEAEAVSEWLAYTTVLLAQADDSVALECRAIADFDAEAEVELSIKQGEHLALLHGVKPPEGWAIALRMNPSQAEQKTKGLVPATYINILPFNARSIRSFSAAGGDPTAAPLELEADAVVRVLPDRSTPDCWWVVREGDGGQGLVPMSLLQPLTPAERMQQLKEEATKVRRDESRRLVTAAKAAQSAAEAAERAAVARELAVAAQVEQEELEEGERQRLRQELAEAAAARKEAEVARAIATQVVEETPVYDRLPAASNARGKSKPLVGGAEELELEKELPDEGALSGLAERELEERERQRREEQEAQRRLRLGEERERQAVSREEVIAVTEQPLQSAPLEPDVAEAPLEPDVESDAAVQRAAEQREKEEEEARREAKLRFEREQREREGAAEAERRREQELQQERYLQREAQREAQRDVERQGQGKLHSAVKREDAPSNTELWPGETEPFVSPVDDALHSGKRQAAETQPFVSSVEVGQRGSTQAVDKQLLVPPVDEVGQRGSTQPAGTQPFVSPVDAVGQRANAQAADTQLFVSPVDEVGQRGNTQAAETQQLNSPAAAETQPLVSPVGDDVAPRDSTQAAVTRSLLLPVDDGTRAAPAPLLPSLEKDPFAFKAAKPTKSARAPTLELPLRGKHGWLLCTSRTISELSGKATAFSEELDVKNTNGMLVGAMVVINPDETTEEEVLIREVKNKQLLLNKPLMYTHHVGEPIEMRPCALAGGIHFKNAMVQSRKIGRKWRVLLRRREAAALAAKTQREMDAATAERRAARQAAKVASAPSTDHADKHQAEDPPHQTAEPNSSRAEDTTRRADCHAAKVASAPSADRADEHQTEEPPHQTAEPSSSRSADIMRRDARQAAEFVSAPSTNLADEHQTEVPPHQTAEPSSNRSADTTHAGEYTAAHQQLPAVGCAPQGPHDSPAEQASLGEAPAPPVGRPASAPHGRQEQLDKPEVPVRDPHSAKAAQTAAPVSAPRSGLAPGPCMSAGASRHGSRRQRKGRGGGVSARNDPLELAASLSYEENRELPTLQPLRKGQRRAVSAGRAYERNQRPLQHRSGSGRGIQHAAPAWVEAKGGVHINDGRYDGWYPGNGYADENVHGSPGRTEADADQPGDSKLQADAGEAQRTAFLGYPRPREPVNPYCSTDRVPAVVIGPGLVNRVGQRGGNATITLGPLDPYAIQFRKQQLNVLTAVYSQPLRKRKASKLWLRGACAAAKDYHNFPI
eukprot:CAMPEP_0113248690 /NCGR_PEP_ID=MMETSP0008_2-20120614/10652_1 /TAXON_ID=97485 /ORGANISM="Prymnesium parvum" /LENGTH=1513 /DNA_ID=CAMNT_0000096557 /DNA_START=91 /DNA_END=4632 /DNA_ORIENTATION=+ /assembly_acc=CAM_ASM_000153